MILISSLQQCLSLGSAQPAKRVLVTPARRRVDSLNGVRGLAVVAESVAVAVAGFVAVGDRL